MPAFKYRPFLRNNAVKASVLFVQDIAFYCLLGGTKSESLPNPRFKRLCIAKLDQLGDLLMITPLLIEIRRMLPSVELVLLTGSWNRSLSDWLLESRYVDEVQFYDAAGCNKGGKLFARFGRQIETGLDSIRKFRKRPPDVWIDLRTHSPNSLLLARLLNIPFRAGFGERGLAYTLHAELCSSADAVLGESFLGALALLGLPAKEYAGPSLPSVLGTKLLSQWDLVPGGYVVVHPFSRDRKRQVGLEVWQRIVAQLVAATNLDVIAVGTANEAASQANLIQGLSAEGVRSMAGETDLRSLAAVIEGAVFVICVDSMVAHLALAYRVRTLVLMNERYSIRESYPRNPASHRFIRADDTGALCTALAEFLLDSSKRS